MSLGGNLRRLVVGEQRCKVIIEVPDLGVDGWRRLSADPQLRWRRLNPGRPLAGPATLRRRRGKVESPGRPDSAAPAPALLEASGAASGTAAPARQRLAVRAMARLSAAGLHGEVLGAAADEPGVEPVEPESVWPASEDVLIFGPADQDELDRRFALVTGAWSVPEGAAAAPSVVEPAQRRRRAGVDVLAGLCVLPLLLMAVPTLGPWLDRRTWALLLAAALVCVALPLLVVQALVPGRPALAAVRSRALGLAAALVVLLVAARLAIRLPVPPLVVLVLAGLLVAGLAPVALRLLPSSRPARAVAVGAPVALALVAAPVGDLLDGVYLDRLGLRPTDVAVSFAQRWWSGAYPGVRASDLSWLFVVTGPTCRVLEPRQAGRRVRAGRRPRTAARPETVSRTSSVPSWRRPPGSGCSGPPGTAPRPARPAAGR